MLVAPENAHALINAYGFVTRWNASPKTTKLNAAIMISFPYVLFMRPPGFKTRTVQKGQHKKQLESSLAGLERTINLTPHRQAKAPK